MLYQPILPTKAQLLEQKLSLWWERQGQYHFGPWAPLGLTHEQQVQAVVDELVQDAELARIQLCNFLGTPEGQVIAAGVEAAIPQPSRLVVQEALMLICQQRGAVRQTVAGVGALVAFAAMVVIALLSATAE